MREALLIVSVILFVLGSVGPVAYKEGPGWAYPSLVSLGLAFFAASFLNAVASN